MSRTPQPDIDAVLLAQQLAKMKNEANGDADRTTKLTNSIDRKSKRRGMKVKLFIIVIILKHFCLPSKFNMFILLHTTIFGAISPKCLNFFF